jgi:Trypsin-co-occurring domain 2
MRHATWGDATASEGGGIVTGEARVPLARVVQGLRSELVEAVRAGEGEEIQFALGPVELEFEVVVEVTAGASGGVRFWVLSFGASGDRSSTDTQTVRLTLTPTRRRAGSASEDVLVSSDLEAR